MAGFTKLFGSLVNSTIWRADDKTRLVWITMLAMAGRDGVVESSLPGLADAARVTIEECSAALAILSGPDKYSRTKDHDGRRVREVDGGWLLLNHAKYRAKMSADERRDAAAVRQQRYRDKNKPRRSAAAVRAEAESRERRFVAAHDNGDGDAADRIAAENLPSDQ